MVAITVILAAVIATFVLQMGGNQSQPVNAAVDVEVSDSNNEVKFTVTDMGNAEEFEVRGDMGETNATDSIKLDQLTGTGNSQTIGDTNSSNTGGNGYAFDPNATGDFSVVGINGDEETTVASFEVDF